MLIKQLDYNNCKGQKYKAEIWSDKYLDIEPEAEETIKVI